MALKALKDMFSGLGEKVEIVSPDEEARLTDFHRRYEIAYIQSSLGAAQISYNDIDTYDVDRNLRTAVASVGIVLASPDYLIDKEAFVTRVLDEVEKTRLLMTKTFPRYARDTIPKHVARLTAMREGLAHPVAVAAPEELAPAPF